MRYTAIITEPHASDAMPMWESFDHADADDAYRAAHTYIHRTRPQDRSVDDGGGGYAILAGAATSTLVATLVIAATGDPHTDEAQPAQQGSSPMPVGRTDIASAPTA